MKYPITQNIIDHLEYLAYAIKYTEEENVDSMFCEHKSRHNLNVSVHHDYVMIETRLIINDLSMDLELYKLLDQVNRKAYATRWWTGPDQGDKGVTIGIDCYTFGYDKTCFAELLEQFELEKRRYLPLFMALADKQTKNVPAQAA